MSKWDKLSKKVWENSEVMNEFENILKKALLDINNKVEAQNLVQKMDTINKSVDDASKKMDTFIGKTKNLAEDNLESDTGDDEKFKEPTKEEQEQAKNQLLAELTELAIQAADERNYKVAYKIERIITAISEED